MYITTAHVLAVTSRSRSCVSCLCWTIRQHHRHRFSWTDFIMDWGNPTPHLTHTLLSCTLSVHSLSFFQVLYMYKTKVVPYLISKCWSCSWSCVLTVSWRSADLVINPVVGCHYFLPGTWLASQQERDCSWLVQNYTPWWQWLAEGHYM